MQGVEFEPTKHCPRTEEDSRALRNRTFSQALSEIVSFGLWMQRSGYRPSTITRCIKALKALAKRTNLLRPEADALNPLDVGAAG